MRFRIPKLDMTDQSLKHITYFVKDLVLLRTHKLSCAFDKIITIFFLLYEGVFKIKIIKSHNAFILEH